MRDAEKVALDLSNTDLVVLMHELDFSANVVSSCYLDVGMAWGSAFRFNLYALFCGRIDRRECSVFRLNVFPCLYVAR